MEVVTGRNNDLLEKGVNNWLVFFFFATGWFPTHCFKESDREAICSWRTKTENHPYVCNFVLCCIV